ncbi:hypothetical protein E1263_22630 [Kribbella antibiotica]|uniref:Uncharacterized protein n=1 Tax=Kribbella antibiotica TaxID=190195 RepID=A0A4R4ZGF7_9ACTN|nr:hypothetical protein [Kribbella antibiotica]TDD57691.1 hypothetical protein E1263_22630 [Kribbella antibiotica]
MRTEGCSPPHEPDLSDSAERAAYHLVPVLLGGGVTAEQRDCCGRQGAVDFLLRYPDGREAALEVTSEAMPRARQLNSLLENKALPNPGNWTWSATVGDPRDLPELDARCERIILACEAAGIREPRYAYELWPANSDINWLMRSSVDMYGSPDLPKVSDGREVPFNVTPGSIGGGTSETLNEFGEVFQDLLGLENVQRHVAKLVRSGQTERHLFLVCGMTALPYSVFSALALRDVMPPTSPPLPVGVTHLWLMVEFSRWVFLVATEGMTRFERPAA